MKRRYRIKFNPTPSQKDLFGDKKTKTLMLSGGLGSGKSYVMVMKALQLSYANKDHGGGGVLAPSYADFKRDLLPLFESICEENKIPYRFHKTDKTFKFPWSRHPIYVFSGDTGAIAGPNLSWCTVNEFSIIHPTRINEMLRRVRVKGSPVMQRVLVGTPEDKFGYLEDFIDAQEKIEIKSPGSWRIIYSDTSDNPHVDPDYRKFLENMLDEQALKVFASGQIIRIGGDYFYYAFNQSVNVDERCQYMKNQTIYVAMDFNVGKMCTSFAHKAGREIQFFDELKLTGNSDTPQMGVAIINRYGRVDREYKDEDEWMMVPEWERREKLEHILVTCDASGNNRKTSGVTDVMILERMGFSVRFRRSNPRLRDRQLLMNGLLSKGNIKIHPNCREIIKDFKNVQQNKKDYTKVKDKDHNLTHFSDGADYLCEFEFELDLDTRSRQIQL
jgi:hypothetical protein